MGGPTLQDGQVDLPVVYDGSKVGDRANRSRIDDQTLESESLVASLGAYHQQMGGLV